MLTPTDLMDPDDVLHDDYNPDEITHASFTIVPGDDVNYCSLVYWANGIEGTSQRWGLSMYYGYQYNGPDIPISERDAKRILGNLAEHRDIEEYDWAAHDWVYLE